MLRQLASAMIVFTIATTSTVIAAQWPEIPAAERQLEKIAEFPNAEAVILLREGRVHFDEDSRSSFIEVYARLKVLNDEGTEHGTIALGSSDYMRTKDIAGRTHLPDGRVVELPKDATFTKEYSDYYGASVVSCAMPEVVTGAIVEYRYRTYFDSIFYPQMWYFQSDLPTLKSTVTFELPHNIAFAPLVYRTLPSVEITEDARDSVTGGNVTYTAHKLPPVPDEPSRFPFADIAARVMLLPTSQRISNMPHPLFDSWEHTLDIVWGSRSWGYKKFLGDDSDTRKKAKSLIAGVEGQRAQADTLYRWVRDEVKTEYYGGILPGDHDADYVLSEKKGDLAEKALLLQAMFDAVKIDSRIGWANPRYRGRIEQNVPNPAQFHDMLVVAKIAGEQVFSTPTDRSLAFGMLPPSLQGVPCLLLTPKESEWVTTPQLAAEASMRQATVQLAVDEEGGVAGSGELRLSGNHAYNRLLWKDSEEETVDAWTSWIEDSYPGHDISDVEVDEDVEACSVVVNWKLALRADEQLGDEVGVSVAAPLEIDANPFTLESSERRTPVQLSFPDLDRVHVELSWPEGWLIDAQPQPTSTENPAGTLTVSLAVDEAARTLVLDRSVAIVRNEFISDAEYNGLRDLYAAAVANDAKEIVLVAE